MTISFTLLTLLALAFSVSANPCSDVTTNTTFCTEKKVVYSCECYQNVCNVTKSVDCLNPNYLKSNELLCNTNCGARITNHNNSELSNKIVVAIAIGCIFFGGIIGFFIQRYRCTWWMYTYRAN